MFRQEDAMHMLRTHSAHKIFVISAAILTLVPVSLFAQVDLSGGWDSIRHEDQIERGAGPEIGDYTGVPINDQARSRADAWDAEKWTQPEHECEPHPADYGARGGGSMRIWAEANPATLEVTAWHTEMMWMQPRRAIYMDHRQHPAEDAIHTWQGFSTGEWVGDTLKVTTTHLKEGWIRRNGIPRSDKATMVEYFIRNGDYLTVVTIVQDPVYLTEPFIRTSDWKLDLGYKTKPSTCIPSVEIEHPRGWVAYHLPGANPFLNEYSETYGIPQEAVRGGAETMYPEYLEKLKKMPVPAKPAKATGNKE
jgi:hypothetical protein